MDILRFTEFSETISPGMEVVLQVPEDEEIPVKVIILAGGRTTQMTFAEFRAICKVVGDGLQQSGRKTE